MRGKFGSEGRHEGHWGGHGRHGRERGWGHGPGRRGRMFDQGDLRFVILRLIQEKPRHGYEIMKAIEEAFGGVYSPSPGVVYPTLTMLEEQGYAQAEEAAGKKAFSLTEAGGAFLEENKTHADALFARIAGVRERFGGAAPASVQRALENIRTAVRLRLQRADWTDESAEAFAAALDEAAKRVERS
ncbi:MAG: PadR family transcriptional regulator [Hyphomonadaceae bacterium]